MDADARVLVAGGGALIGGALARLLRQWDIEFVAGGDEPELANPDAVEQLFGRARPTHVIYAGGPEGGIHRNRTEPAWLMQQNILRQTNVIDAAHRHAVRKLLYLGSSCSYPRDCPQPMAVSSLLTGALEPTNEAYAVAKLAGLTLCQAYRRQHGAPFIVAIPANAFGPGDDFDRATGHVVSALIATMDDARHRALPRVDIWGTGAARRDFIYVDDLADACLTLLDRYDDPTPINVGTGAAISIRGIAQEIRTVVGYRGQLDFDARQPDGMPVKVLDSAAITQLGWQPSTSLRAGLERTYAWYRQRHRTHAPEASYDHQPSPAA